MVSFYVYDISILVIFAALLIFFFQKNKKNLKIESVVIMYRTQTGIKLINWFGDSFKKTLHVLKYFIIFVGLILAFAILWTLGKTFYIYAVNPSITDAISAPPIAPLVPYFPEIFGLESMFPNLYFIYFVIALAVVMLVHEFSHGVYMRLFKIKIKSTGLLFAWLIYTWVFLGFVNFFVRITKKKNLAYFAATVSCLILIFAILFYSITRNFSALFILVILIFPLLGAFVEEEKTGFMKKKKLEQMTVLGAGVFANIVTGIIFLLLLLMVYHIGYNQAGYGFNSYSATYIPAANITSYGDSFEGVLLLQGFEQKANLTEIEANGQKYLITESIRQEISKGNPEEYTVLAFYDAPAIRNNIEGGIVKIDGTKISGLDDLGEFLSGKNPGETVNISTIKDGKTKEYEIVLAKNPTNLSKAFIGISYIPMQTESDSSFSAIGASISNGYSKITNPEIRENGNFFEASSFTVTFIYDLLWWIVIINFSVALFNMLPFGPFDGGRFFYLAVLSVTGSKEIAKWTSKILAYFILFGFVMIMVLWAIRVL